MEDSVSANTDSDISGDGHLSQIATKLGNRLKRKNSISDIPVNNLDLKGDLRPPTRHTYVSPSSVRQTNYEIAASRHGSSRSITPSRPLSPLRPMTPSSMILSLDSSREKISDFNEASRGSEDHHSNKDNLTKPKSKKYLALALVFGSVCLIALIIALALFLSPRTVGKGHRTTDTPSTMTTVTSSTVTTENNGTTAHTTTEQPMATTEFQTPQIVIEDNDNITYGGAWSVWSSWSACSRSCSVGFQHRSRTCESEQLQCQGVNQQQRRCNTVLCSISDPEAVWTTWNAWVECSQTCGTGSQVRGRLCLSANDSTSVVDSCVGNSQQHRACNEFPCPDCSAACADGHLSDACTHCQCSETLIGQVLSDRSLPLANVTISPRNAPYVIIATTGAGGYFTINELCSSDFYVFRKDGYLDTEVTFTEATMNITMQQRVAFQIVSNPQNVMSVDGDSIHLCCEAIGLPPPNYYEWMKNGEIVAEDVTSGHSTYTIEDASTEDTGYYTCRASNDHTAIYSTPATVLVQDSAHDFCTESPQPNLIALPAGCSHQNSTTIDKGLCENNACYGGESTVCTRSRTHCCGPTSLTRVDVDCVNYSIPVFVVTSCGCAVCRRSDLTIYGFAGSRDGMPLQYGDIYWNGSWISNTSYDGTFSFTVDSTISRASVLFVDSYNQSFLDSTYVFETPNSGGSQFIRINLLRRGQIFHLNTSVQSTISLNLTTIDIPPGSFFTSDGQPYEGDVVAAITTIDPSDIEQIASAPGDFSIVDEEGDVQQLLSYGMFGMAFEDDNGNRLSIPGEITLTVPQDILGDINDTSSVRVWTLNPSTGRWEFASDLADDNQGHDDISHRRRRQISPGIWGQITYTATLRGIPIDVQWFNFDAISTQTCIVKIRLFETDRYTEGEQLSGGRVSVVLQDSSGYNSLSSNRVQTDSDNNGFCMVLPCESSRSSSTDIFRGYIFADYGSEELIPAATATHNNGPLNNSVDLDLALNYTVINNKILVDFNQSLIHSERMRGPFYDWERKWRYSTACSSATYETENYFQFSQYTNCLVENDAYDDIFGDPEFAWPLHLLLWYDITSYFPYVEGESPFLRRFYAFKACYIKVLAPRHTLVEAISYIADDRHLYYHDENDTVYGVRQDCATDGAVCLHVRPPGNPRIAPFETDQHAVDNERKTLISIKTVDSSYSVISISEDLLTLAHTRNDVLTNVSANEMTFKMFLTFGTSYGSNLGIYCYHGDTEEVAEQALHMCRNGVTSNDEASRVPRVNTTTNSWAVQFGVPQLGIDIGTSCRSLYDSGLTQDGIYTINPDGLGEFDVYCELNPTRTDGSEGGGWTVFQRRVDDSVDFFRDWSQYEEGFGDLGGNLWLGLDKLARLTAGEPVELHVYLETFENTWAYAYYRDFQISGSVDNYRLSVSGYSGTAGDSLARQNGNQFTTRDRDNDLSLIVNCAETFTGAWWYETCLHSNLNGQYFVGFDGTRYQGVVWYHFQGYDYSLKTAIMKVRPHSS